MHLLEAYLVLVIIKFSTFFLLQRRKLLSPLGTVFDLETERIVLAFGALLLILLSLQSSTCLGAWFRGRRL